MNYVCRLFNKGGVLNCGDGEIRTLILFRELAPEASAFAISPHPRYLFLKGVWGYLRTLFVFICQFSILSNLSEGLKIQLSFDTPNLESLMYKYLGE